MGGYPIFVPPAPKEPNPYSKNRRRVQTASPPMKGPRRRYCTRPGLYKKTLNQFTSEQLYFYLKEGTISNGKIAEINMHVQEAFALVQNFL